MAKKLADIESKINGEALEFNTHLHCFLPDGIIEFLNFLLKETQVYLFSGIIRNYFLKKTFEIRDVDFIIEDDLDIVNLFPNLEVTRNSFGGFKTNINSIPVDIWVISKTWGLNRGQLKFPYNQLEHLPNTTFFNFSSIIFSINEKRFIIGKPFLRFLRDRKIDIVLEDNPYPALCIVNSFYYSEKYHLGMSPKLRKYVRSKFNDSKDKFDVVQLKHFGKIIYDKGQLIEKLATVI